MEPKADGGRAKEEADGVAAGEGRGGMGVFLRNGSRMSKQSEGYFSESSEVAGGCEREYERTWGRFPPLPTTNKSESICLVSKRSCRQDTLDRSQRRATAGRVLVSFRTTRWSGGGMGGGKKCYKPRACTASRICDRRASVPAARVDQDCATDAGSASCDAKRAKNAPDVTREPVQRTVLFILLPLALVLSPGTSCPNLSSRQRRAGSLRRTRRAAPRRHILCITCPFPG